MNNKGITLIELIIVVTIIGVLAVALGFSFQGWAAKYKVESQTKNIYMDMMNTRARAMQRNKNHFVAIAAANYAIYEDTNPAPDGDGILQQASDTLLPTFPKTVEYTINVNGSGAGNITFDRGGLISPSRTIWLTTTVASDYDCIVISPTRINMGACNGTNCANCDTK